MHLTPHARLDAAHTNLLLKIHNQIGLLATHRGGHCSFLAFQHSRCSS